MQTLNQNGKENCGSNHETNKYLKKKRRVRERGKSENLETWRVVNLGRVNEGRKNKISETTKPSPRESLAPGPAIQ